MILDVITGAKPAHPTGAFSPFVVATRHKTVRRGPAAIPFDGYSMLVSALTSRFIVTVLKLKEVVGQRTFTKLDKIHEVMMDTKIIRNIKVARKVLEVGQFFWVPFGWVLLATTEDEVEVGQFLTIPFLDKGMLNSEYVDKTVAAEVEMDQTRHQNANKAKKPWSSIQPVYAEWAK